MFLSYTTTRSLTFSVSLRVLPQLIILYLMSYVDRTNVGKFDRNQEANDTYRMSRKCEAIRCTYRYGSLWARLEYRLVRLLHYLLPRSRSGEHRVAKTRATDLAADDDAFSVDHLDLLLSAEYICRLDGLPCAVRSSRSWSFSRLLSSPDNLV